MCCTATIFGVIVGSILLALSFYIVEPNSVGVDYNHLSQTIDDAALYKAGRHFLGVGHSMIIYDTTQQSQDLGFLTGRSKDGLSVDFNVNYQFLYNQDVENLAQLYKDYLGEHLKWFDFFAGSSLRNTLADFTAFQVIQERDTLALQMEANMKDAFSQMGVEVTRLQLLSTSLPERFMGAIEETILAEQAVEKAEFDLAKAKITGETLRLQAAIAAENIIVTADAESTSTVLESEANAMGNMVQLKAEEVAYKLLFDNAKAKFPSFSAEQLIAYIWTESIAETDAGKVLVNMVKEVELA